MDLCKLLKGHEGETFYSPALGSVTLISIGRYDNDLPIEIHNGSEDVLLTSEGKLYDCDEAEVMLFPSKDQRDWNKWAEEQKPKVPKTWSELKSTCSLVNVFEGNNFFHPTPIEKAALALLKIHQLIEVGYGGNITKEEWDDDHLLKYLVRGTNNEITPGNTYSYNNHIAFHTQQQRDEFLSYPENVQLVKDFYMILKPIKK